MWPRSTFDPHISTECLTQRNGQRESTDNIEIIYDVWAYSLISLVYNMIFYSKRGILQSHIKMNHKMFKNNAHIFDLLCVYSLCVCTQSLTFIFLFILTIKQRYICNEGCCKCIGGILGPPKIMCNMLATQYYFLLNGKKYHICF